MALLCTFSSDVSFTCTQLHVCASETNNLVLKARCSMRCRSYEKLYACFSLRQELEPPSFWTNPYLWFKT